MTEERDAFEQFVEEFDTAVEPTNELEPELEVVPEEPVAEEPPLEATPPQPEPAGAPEAAVTQSAPAASPDLTSELAKLREEISRLREAPPPTAQQPAETYESVREKAYGELEKVYRPRDEELENFISDPGPALARMASRLHVSIVENVAQLVQQHMSRMPQFLEAREQQNRAAQGFWGKFDQRWPELGKADPAYREKVAGFGQAYRQFNPKATEDSFIEHVGAQVSLMLGLVPSTVQAGTPTPRQPPTKPPARGGKPGSPQGRPTSEWDALARDFESDDTW